VKGPLPAFEDFGGLVVEAAEMSWLHHQGSMLTGVTMTGYLNLLANRFYQSGVRRTDDDFVSRLEHHRSESGSKHGWDACKCERADQQSGETGIICEDAKVILFQIFREPREAGHWSLLVVDRTRPNAPVAVLF